MSMRRTWVASLLLLLVAAWPARADDDPLLARGRAAAEKRDAQGLLDAVIARYRALEGFTGDGEIVTDMTMFGKGGSMTTRFSVVAQRPDRYRVTWSTTGASVDGR